MSSLRSLPHQFVRQQVSGLAWRAPAAQVVAVRVGAQRHAADAPRHQAGLVGLHHAQGDVGLAAQQVADLVAGHQLHLDVGELLAHAQQQRGQQQAGHGLAGADAHRAAGAGLRAGDATCQRMRAGLHGARRLGQPQRRGRGLQAPAGALEQHRAQLRLQLGDMAAHGGLAGLQGARRAQQATVLQHGQEGAHQVPVERGIHG
jgi:hypothetical protein